MKHLFLVLITFSSNAVPAPGGLVGCKALICFDDYEAVGYLDSEEMQIWVALNKPSKSETVCVLINGDVDYDFRSHFPYHSHSHSRQLRL